MYHDLDTTRPGFSTNDIVGTLLGGTEANVGATPFSPDYDVDDPEFEEKVPLLVTEADSSQFSTLVDIAGGQNLAVEGPPGTGKSQTIVNAIAAAIANGKKVLFVAEKLAALDVVRARLEHAGLAEFLLPLQATRSSREQVARSINERLSLRNERFPNELATRQAEFREARDSLSEYVALMQTEFGETGMTIHEVLGASLITDDALEGLSWELQAAQLPHVKVLDNRAIERIRVLARDLSSAECALRDHMSDWRGLTLSLVDRFTADDLMRRARETSELYRAANQARARLREVEIADERTHEELHELGQSLESLARDVRKSDVALILNIFCTSDPKRCLADLKTFLDSCDVYRASAAMFSELFEGEPDEALLQSIEKTIEVCERHEIDSVDLNTLARRREKLEQYLAQCEKMNAALREFIGAVPELSKLPITVFSKASRLLGNTQSQTLILRSPGVAQAGAVEQLRSAIVQGKELLERQRRLARIFTIELLPKASAILDVSSTLKNGGFFSFLSSDYRAAKRFWNKIRRTQGFEREAAAEALLALGRWKLEVEKFEANPQWRDLLPDGLIGLEMSFEGYMALVDYLEAVECLFPGLSMRPIQHFMKSAEVDLLRGIPDVAECENVELSFENLGPHINKCKTDLSVLQKVMGELEAPTKRIVNFAGVTPATLPELAQGVRETISRRDGLLKNTEVVDLLGPRYHGLESECPRFETECEVAKKLLDAHDDQSILLNAIQNGSFDRVRGLVAKYLSAYRDASEALQELQHDAGAPAIPEAMELSQVAVVLERAAVDRDGLNNAADFKRAWSALKDEGFEEILADLQKVDALSDNLPEILEAIVRRAAVRELHREHEAVLQRYPGTTLDRLRERLASADKRVLELSQRQLRAQLIEESRPPAGQGVGRKSQYTELALLQNEANKKRGFFPTRDVVTRAGRALQELKPCWMMSPLAISQYLPPDAIKFDLCIIDEASQMTPENSIGALIRARQAMVVGDTNQLPPTNFFRKMIVDDDADEDETVIEESILELANAAFRPSRRLRWHYRSRHSGLIQFSNRLVYDDDLIVFPSAAESRADMGVSLVSVDEGIYKSGANPREAQMIVKAVLQFMRSHPGRSLGVVTLNQKQRDLIQEELDHAISRDRAALEYVDRWNNERDGLESFFVKNLENVQGDERDVIYIGTVYGPQQPGGRVYQRFGPINGVAGRRRLNVLFSRAKEQIVTFSSMTAADITADENGNAGAYMLKRWLEYAATGRLEAGEVVDREPDSDFELYVAQQILAMGCEPVHQVGVVGYFIDIGVRHPRYPHGFLMGVECDGATYHSSRSARDRDRLRQEVLEGLGWTLYRVWSTDWFRNPVAEAERLREAIEAQLELASKKKIPERYGTEPVSRDDVTASEGEGVEHRDATPPAPRSPPDVAPGAEPEGSEIRAGDTVLVRYVSGVEGSLKVTLSDRVTDPDNGVIHTASPLGQTLLGMEEGDEIEVLVGNRVRKAEIENVSRA